VKVQKVAEEQGVRYVLEGSVQKSQDRVRITVQLIDAIKGIHLWSERYDRDLKDLFALQDEISMKIMTALQVKLTEGEHASAVAGTTSNLNALEYFWHAEEHFFRFSKEENAEARQWAEKAIELDSNFAGAWALLGWTHLTDVTWGNSPAQYVKRAEECAHQALSINDSTGKAQSLMGTIRVVQGKYDEGVEYGEKALALNPNDPDLMYALSMALGSTGRFDEAIVLIKKAMRICPYYPAFYLQGLATFYVNAGRYREAVEAGELLLDRSRKGEISPFRAHICLAEAYVGLGQIDKAKAEAEEVLKINPKYFLESDKTLGFYKDPIVKERRIAALRKAGLPEKPPLPLPDKPSIAVLPFVNMSEDKSQEYFSDGLTEEIITALSKTPKLFVIARNSTFVYKGKAVNVQQVSRELGVKYVLEGSVRRSGDQLRITAQLIDATTGNHLWAERYERSLGQIFSLQDDITLAIVRALRVTLTEGEQANLMGKGTTNLDAYLKALEANEQFFRMNREGSIKAKQLAGEAIALDPKYAFPYAIMANAHMLDLWFGFGKSPEESMKLASEAAHKALSLDNSDPSIQVALCNLYIMQRQYDQAIASAERAVELCPSGARAHYSLGTALVFACRFTEAVRALEFSIRLDPFPSGRNFSMLGSAYRELGRYEEAIEVYKKGLQVEPGDVFTHLGLAVAYIKTGREAEASNEAAEVMKLHPNFSLDSYGKIFHLKDQSIADDYLASLRKAGLK
jgi:TolB-like protein/Tfp pilus assembly protein PilF